MTETQPTPLVRDLEQNHYFALSEAARDEFAENAPYELLNSSGTLFLFDGYSLQSQNGISPFWTAEEKAGHGVLLPPQSIPAGSYVVVSLGPN